jgi:hypothetical protein
MQAEGVGRRLRRRTEATGTDRTSGRLWRMQVPLRKMQVLHVARAGDPRVHKRNWKREGLLTKKRLRRNGRQGLSGFL